MPIRANHSNLRFARITPLRMKHIPQKLGLFGEVLDGVGVEGVEGNSFSSFPLLFFAFLRFSSFCLMTRATRANNRDVLGKAKSTIDQKPVDHPNFRKNALGVKRSFSELSESSGYSRSSSRNSNFHSRNTQFHSRNGIPRLEQSPPLSSKCLSVSRRPRNVGSEVLMQCGLAAALVSCSLLLL